MPFVYKITSPNTDKVYVGSTTRTLHTRFRQHLKKCNPTTSKEIIDFGDAVIECLEEVDIDIMKQRERYYIELMRDKCVNQVIPLRTLKEWWEDNKDYLYHHRRDYIAKLETINCECGSSCKKNNHIQHSKTKKHLKYLGLI